MILRTFTRNEVIRALHRAYETFEERARGYCNHNVKALAKKIGKEKKVERVFSCEMDGQRYYEKFIFILKDGYISGMGQSVATLFNDSREPFVLLHSPTNFGPDDYYFRTSRELRIFSSHFINRFFERSGRNPEGMDLIGKTMVILSEMQSISASTVNDEVIRRYGEPALSFAFLQEGKKETECSYLNDGDIAIVERYGPVPVWRTYVSKDMLFKEQLDFVDRPDIQEGVQAAKEISKQLNNID